MAKVRVRQASVDDLLAEFKKFEERYHMASGDFYVKYQRGEMGDSADVIEWSSIYEWVEKKRGQQA
ncbi:MAG: hypothetical protein WD904_11985 [Dehalococcoidia bacterium]